MYRFYLKNYKGIHHLITILSSIAIFYLLILYLNNASSKSILGTYNFKIDML